MNSLKCYNCGIKVGLNDINAKKAFTFKQNGVLCLNCYMIFYGKARDYLYNHPNTSRKDLATATKIPTGIIDLLLNEGALFQVVKDDLNKLQEVKKENDNKQKIVSSRASLIKDLNKSMNSGTVEAKPRMRFIEHKKH